MSKREKREMSDSKKKQIENRNLLSLYFVTLLIGLAYSEMVPPVRESVRASGITYGTSVLVAIFFMTSIRFFVGNTLHLLSEGLMKLPGLIWLYDLVIIIIQSVIFIFLGGVSSLDVNRKISIGFVELLIALYIVDVIWVISQWGWGKILPNWKRPFIPWAWAILNAILVALMLLLRIFVNDMYSALSLSILLSLNLIAFILDVVLVDYFDAI